MCDCNCNCKEENEKLFEELDEVIAQHKQDKGALRRGSTGLY